MDPSASAPDPFRLMFPVAVLQAHAKEAEIILRAGAAANALLTLGRTALRHEGLSGSRADGQDRIQVMFMAAAYVFEFYKTVSKVHGGLGWQLIEGGITERDLPAGWTLESVKQFFEDPTSSRIISTIRDKCAFHWDPEPFRDFLATLPSHLPLELQRVEGAEVSNIVFSASYNALIVLFRPEEMEPVLDKISELVIVIPYLVEAMIVGFAKSASLDPSKHVHRL